MEPRAQRILAADSRDDASQQTQAGEAADIATREKICQICGSQGHYESNCTQPCRYCGIDEHCGRDCSQSSMACLCAKYPRHLVHECSIVCRWCFYTSGARHPAMTCDIRCCMCNQHLSAEHRHESGRLLGDASTRIACHDRRCHLCNGPHLTQDCETRLCAVE